MTQCRSPAFFALLCGGVILPRPPLLFPFLGKISSQDAVTHIGYSIIKVNAICEISLLSVIYKNPASKVIVKIVSPRSQNEISPILILTGYYRYSGMLVF